MSLNAKLRSRQGAYKLEFESEHGQGHIWLSELENVGVVVVRVYGDGDFAIEDMTISRDLRPAPCRDPNAYQQLSHDQTPLPPCGRPKGHPEDGAGNGGGTGPWGKGHSVNPGPNDSPTRKLILVPAHWKVER